MPLEIKSQEIKANSSASFEFSDNITQYFIGFSSLCMTYGSVDHHVKQARFKLTPSGASGKSIVIKAEMTLGDDNGHSESSSSSKATVVVAAWVTPNNNDLCMVSQGKAGESFLAPGTPNLVCVPLSGFDLSYGDDHHVLKLGSNAGHNYDSSSKRITLAGSAEMQDDGKNRASNNGVWAGLMAYAGPSTNFYYHHIKLKSHETIDLTEVPDLAASGFFINSFHVSFGSSDHHVKSIDLSLGLEEGDSVVKGTNRIKCLASIRDDSSHSGGWNPPLPHIPGLFPFSNKTDCKVEGFLLGVKKS